MTQRILFLGESWLGSGGRACSSALRRMGCDVELLDFGTVFPSPRQPWLRAALRVAERAFVREYNLRILTLARQLRPDMLISFKGSHVTVRTLRVLRSMGISLYNYYPDRLYFAVGTPLAET
ncbi:MAG: hypothetical protein M3O50_15060, partial [Myxococcota bacterium]|nr:hypothetical protein [Myxococcota bacterium]